MAAASKAKPRLTLEQIWEADDLKHETVDVPEWGGTIEIKPLTKGEHQECRRKSIKRGEVDPDLLELNLLCAGVVDPKLTQEDGERLKRKNAGTIERLLRDILRISGLDQNAVSEADRRFRD